MRRAAPAAALALLWGCGGEEPRAPNVIVAPPAASAPAEGAGRGAPAAGRPAPAAASPATPATAPPRREVVRGGRVVFAFAGTTAPRRLLVRLRRGEAAGAILFARNVASRAQVRRLTRSLRAAARRGGQPPPLIMVDQEGGPVRRLPGAPTRTPRAMGTVAVARSEGRATARTLRAAGVNVDLAPVVDVVRPGSALDREGRGFLGRARVVRRLGAAFAEGLQDGGVAATLKHFPGFGAAAGNTDVAAQRVGLPRSTLRDVDVVPFRGTRARLVMYASAVYPAFDDVPAVLSRAVERELRERVGFAGVTISDALDTPALAAHDVSRARSDLLLFAQTYRAGARAAARMPADRAAHDRVVALRRALR